MERSRTTRLKPPGASAVPDGNVNARFSAESRTPPRFTVVLEELFSNSMNSVLFVRGRYMISLITRCGWTCTTTRNVCSSWYGGGPSSVTRTVSSLVLAPWSGSIGQRIQPVSGSIDKPGGAPVAKEKLRFCGGRSASNAWAWTSSVSPSRRM